MQESNYPIAWSEEYSMQVAEIDAQHKHFVSILNNLYTAFEKNELKEKAEYILNDLASYAVNHFATEEKYFDLYKYEFAEEHKLWNINIFWRR
jgi:hemerythrin-like metal-binding protein